MAFPTLCWGRHHRRVLLQHSLPSPTPPTRRAGNEWLPIKILFISPTN
ncbi:MAG: hypothetical protein EBZ77_01440 [Chitinophagia bacterium]|nr:hypothetical protein [Chitinophagia bacterium]